MAGETFGHYEVLELLGQGGMGSVFKARDPRLERHVAIKTLRAEKTADPAGRRRFAQEARAASALNHPNILTIYEIAEWDGQDYIAMEYVEGRTLRTLVTRAPDLAAVLPILRQMAEAITAAHAAGIVHRDLKPENLMLRPDGYVKVLDFGLARLTVRPDRSHPDTNTRPGAVFGTARYMSPEQARGERAESPSDIFSLGIVFFELCTGVHPFHAGPNASTAWAILTEPPTPPTRLNPEIPAALEDLLLRMLAKEAVLRPRGTDVLAELTHLARPEGPAAPRRLGPVKRLSVGRERERQELAAAFEAAAAGTDTLVCVTGEPGLGKTTLVEEFVEALRAQRDTAWVARGRCSERLSGADALLPLLEGLDSLIRGESGDQVARMTKRVAPNWYVQVAPSVGEATQEAVALAVKTASQERLKRELYAILEELASTRPVVLFLDDVHWSDASTCDLLSYVGTRGRELPLLLIATYRPAELMESRHVFLQVRAQWQARGACRDLPLDFLTRDDVERLVALRFPDHRFPPDFTSLAHAKTEGNPLFVSDMLRYLRDSGVLKPQDAGWVLTRPIERFENEIPGTVRSMIELKIERFSEDDRKLLVAAAVQGIEFDSAVLARALGRDPADVEDRLKELETVHGFVRAVGEQEFPDRTPTLRHRFVHAFYQNALYASLGPSRRAALSGSIANAIIAMGGDKHPAFAANLAFLFESAREFARAAPFFLAAARHDARLFAHAEAAILAGRGLKALETLPDSDERARLELPLSLTLGIALMATHGYAAPEVERSHERSRALCLRLGDNRRLFPVLWSLWVVQLVRGQIQRALELAGQLQAPAEASKEPANLVEALHAQGSSLSYLGRLEEGRGFLERALQLYDPKQHPFFASVYVLDPSITTLCLLGQFGVLLGHLDEGLRRVEEAVERARRLGHPQSLAYATFFKAWVHHDRGEVEPTLALAEEAMALSHEHALHQILEWARVARGWALCAEGKLNEGVAAIRQSLEAQARMHSALERPYCLALLARGLAHQGHYGEAQRVIDEALALAEANDERFREAELHRIRGEVVLGHALEHEATADREDEVAQPRRNDRRVIDAEAAFSQARDLAGKAGAHLLELRAATSLFRLHERLGDPGPAREPLARSLAWFQEGTESPHVAAARRLLAKV